MLCDVETIASASTRSTPSPSLSTPSSVVEGVTIVNDAASAERALETIRELEAEDPDRIHAWIRRCGYRFESTITVR